MAALADSGGATPSGLMQKSRPADAGKNEPLQDNLAGCWSRRINAEHRLVVRLEGELLVILTCRYHDR